MPRARRRPALTARLSPRSEAALEAFVRDVRARGDAARARRLSGAAPEAGAQAGPQVHVRDYRGRRDVLLRQIGRLQGQRARYVEAGAYDAVMVVDRQLAELRLRLRNAEARDAAREEKLARRGRGQTQDRFALLVARSERLMPVHLEIADALRDQVLMAGMAGGVPGAVSGQAGDGQGNTRFTWHPQLGLVELGEEFWGALGNPAGAGGASAGRRTIKRVLRASDGGMARAADAVKRARGLVRLFAEGAAAGCGGETWPAEVAVRVILLNQELERACEAVVEMRMAQARKVAETAMIAGLEAVADAVGVAL